MYSAFDSPAQAQAISLAKNEGFKVTGWDFSVAMFLMLYFFDSIFPHAAAVGICG